MRIFLAVGLLLVMMGSAMAQEAPRDFQTKQIPSAYNGPMKLDLHQFGVERAKPLFAPPTDDRCFYIRSYNFKREDGNAPELKDVTTCTKAKANAMRQTKKRPAKFVPLSW